MRTLQGWATKNNVVVSRHCHARCVASNAPNQSELFRLDDYYVSSITGGTIWLIRRNERFSESEKNIRANIRNSCVGMTLIRLDLYMHEREGFERDCIEEFLMEMQAEERDK